MCWTQSGWVAVAELAFPPSVTRVQGNLFHPVRSERDSVTIDQKCVSEMIVKYYQHLKNKTKQSQRNSSWMVSKLYFFHWKYWKYKIKYRAGAQIHKVATKSLKWPRATERSREQQREAESSREAALRRLPVEIRWKQTKKKKSQNL